MTLSNWVTLAYICIFVWCVCVCMCLCFVCLARAQSCQHQYEKLSSACKSKNYLLCLIKKAGLVAALISSLSLIEATLPDSATTIDKNRLAYVHMCTHTSYVCMCIYQWADNSVYVVEFKNIIRCCRPAIVVVVALLAHVGGEIFCMSFFFFFAKAKP